MGPANEVSDRSGLWPDPPHCGTLNECSASLGIKMWLERKLSHVSVIQNMKFVSMYTTRIVIPYYYVTEFCETLLLCVAVYMLMHLSVV